MKKTVLIFAAFMLWGFITKAQPEWGMVTVPGLPDNAIIEAMWTKQEGKLFLAAHQYVYTDSAKIMVYYFNGVSWTTQFQLSGNKRVIPGPKDIFGTNESDVFLNVRNTQTNISEVYHFDGYTWQQQPMPTELGTAWLGNFAGETNNVYAGAESSMFKYDGTSWQYVTNLNGKAAGNLIYINENEIYALDCWGHTLWNGSNWTWYQSFDFCDVGPGWGMRDADNNLFMFATGGNNFGNGIRVWRFVENSTGSMIGSWGSKYDCTYLCDPTGSGYAWAGWGTSIWASDQNDIYVAGNFGHPYNPNYAIRIYHSDGTFPFTRMTIFDTMPLVTNASNYGTQNVAGSGPNDVWVSVGNKLAHYGIAKTTISVSGQTINWLDTFEVPISTSALKEDSNYISYQFNLNYDNSKLQYISNSLTGTIAEGGTALVNEATPGNLLVSYMTTTPLLGAGDIIKLQFNAVETGPSPLTITDFFYNNTSVTTTSGTITVIDTTPPTAAITYSDADGFVRYDQNLMITATFSEPMAGSPVPQIILSGANTLTATDMTKVSETVYTYTHSVALGDGAVTVSLATGTDTHGNLVTSTPTSGNRFNVIPITYGDVDDNGHIRAYDAALTLMYSVGLDPLPAIDPLPWESWRIETANVDGVGNITAYDAALILQYSVGIITHFPVEDTKKSTLMNDAEISITIVDNKLVFKSEGNLFGLNLTTDGNTSSLDVPVLLDNNMIKAYNISDTRYSIGIATAYAPAENTPFMEIPIKHGGNITLTMITNSVSKTVNIDIETGIVEFSDAGISIYPNPAKDILTVSGISKPTVANIYTISGKLVQKSALNNFTNEITLNNLPVGTYILKLQADKEIAVKRFVKQ